MEVAVQRAASASPSKPTLHIVRPYLRFYPTLSSQSPADTSLFQPSLRGGDDLLHDSPGGSGSNTSKTYAVSESDDELSVAFADALAEEGCDIPVYDGTGRSLPRRSSFESKRAGIKHSAKDLLRHPRRVRPKYPRWPPHASWPEKLVVQETTRQKEERAAKEAAVSKKVAALSAKAESGTSPENTSIRAYPLPLNRPSFHRIVKSFIQVEDELYRREQGEHRPQPQDKSPHKRQSGNVNPLPIQPLSESLSNPSSQTTPPFAGYPATSRPKSNRGISRAGVHGHDFVTSAQGRRQKAEARASLLLERNYGTADRNHALRGSDGTASTEGEVANAPFMPEAMHVQGDILQDRERWYLPVWERYKPWEIIFGAVFVMTFLGVLIACAVLLLRNHGHHRPGLAQVMNGSNVVMTPGPARRVGVQMNVEEGFRPPLFYLL